MKNANYVLSKFTIKKDMGSGRYQALCPDHDDHDPSLSITVKHDKILLKCHAGCPTENVLRAKRVEMVGPI
jgi:DNA primase